MCEVAGCNDPLHRMCAHNRMYVRGYRHIIIAMLTPAGAKMDYVKSQLVLKYVKATPDQVRSNLGLEVFKPTAITGGLNQPALSPPYPPPHSARSCCG